MVMLVKPEQHQRATILLGLIVASIVLLKIASNGAECAPATNGGNGNNNKNTNTNNNRNIRTGFFSNLFRRQTSSSSSAGSSTAASESSRGTDPADEAQLQTELEAQKFMESLPNGLGKPSNDNNEPSTFRERVTDTFGVLRDGVNNHFRSIRDNFSDTVDDLRDTWSNGSSE